MMKSCGGFLKSKRQHDSTLHGEPLKVADVGLGLDLAEEADPDLQNCTVDAPEVV